MASESNDQPLQPTPSPTHSTTRTFYDSDMAARMPNVNSPPSARPSTESEEDERWKSTNAQRRGPLQQQARPQTQVRHRASRAGTRSVNKLSPAQLARKRANDREAQRAIRRRTKDQIETLEQQVRDLSDPAKDLRIAWEIQQRNRELENEVAALKERIGALQMQNAGAMNAGAPLGIPMGGLGRDMNAQNLGMQWPQMGMGYGAGEGMSAGFGGADMVLSREETPASVADMASYAPSEGLISPFPTTESPANSFSDLDLTSRIDFTGCAGGDDLGLGSDLASRQYFLPTHFQYMRLQASGH